MYLTQREELNIIPEEAFSSAIKAIEQELTRCGKTGYFTPEEGVKIYYEYFPAQSPRGSVVFVHGLSEFTKKYYEFAAYFVSQGYNVFLYDQRGHGKSHRDTPRPELIHVNSFDQLVSDLDFYIEQIVRPASSVPLYLYAHSLGGAVGMLYLAKHGHKLKKAVLTSPLVVPRMDGYPVLPFLVGVSIRQQFAGPLAKFRFSGEYQVGKPYTPDPGDSPSRMRYCLQWRDREPLYRSTPMTLGCVYHSLKLRRRLLSREVADAIRTPTLMLCADTDALVRTRPQSRFAEKCAACTHEILTNANHALHTDRQEILTKALHRILTFFAE